jgi:hypothetical protein
MLVLTTKKRKPTDCKKLLDAVSRALIDSFEIPSNCAVTQHRELRITGGEEALELAICNNFEGPVCLSDPTNNVHTKGQ